MIPRPGWARALGLAAVLSSPLAGCGGAPPPEPATPSPGSEEPEEPKLDTTATLDVTCLPPAEVKIDGKSIGQSPLNTKLPPGDHDVTCVDPQSGPSTMSVTLAPGEGRSVSLGNGGSTTQENPGGSGSPDGKGKK